MISIKTIIKKKTPALFRLLGYVKQVILNVLIKLQKKSLRKKIESYYKDDPETQEIILYLKENNIEMIPYFYTKEYRKKDVKVIHTEHLLVTHVNSNNIFFPEEMGIHYVENSVRVALMEQDERSPHKYLPSKEIDIQGDVAVLCGASDCIYALQIIDRFKKLYLFEANPIWIDPIKKTLREYLHKIEIVPYFVSDKNGADTVTIDSFFEKRSHEKVDYIQADIEGDESKMLKGAKNLLDNSRSIKLSVCCYHSADQQRELTDLLLGHGFVVKPSPGYLLLCTEYPLRAPYLRRGVLYAFK